MIDNNIEELREVIRNLYGAESACSIKAQGCYPNNNYLGEEAIRF
jgi:hypothetical protein